MVFLYHIWMWELDHKEGWALKNWWFWIVVPKETPESPLDCKETKPDNPKGNKLLTITGKTDTEVEAPILWPPDGKSWFIRKDPYAGKDWGQEWSGWQRMRRLDGFTDSSTWVWANSGREWRTGKDREGQWSLVYCSQWGCKELDMT